MIRVGSLVDMNGRVLIALVPFVLLTSSCGRNGTSSLRGSLTPTVVTTKGRVIERFEEQRQRANDLYRQRMADGEPPTEPPDLSPEKLKAAARGRFAQIWWSARFPHGQKATPTVIIGDGIIRCGIELDGASDSSAGTDWASYMTNIDHLAARSYRIIAPLDEVTLRVPEVFVP